ncbi:MAG: EamA family transporter RarD [Microthrixaceae bacterium]
MPTDEQGAAEHQAAQYRIGVLGGVGAYTMWGLFPLFFHRLEPTSPLEIIGHRIIWTAVLMTGVLSLGAGWGWVRPLLADRRRAMAAGVAGFLLSANWLIYVWAVTSDRVVDASLGYFINPLVTVVLGVLVLGETLRPLQWAAVTAGAISVLVLVLGYGAMPWVSLGLAATFGTYGLLKKQVGLGPVEALAAETVAVAPVAFLGMGWALAAGQLDFPTAPLSMKLLLLAAGAVTAAPLLAFGVATNRIPLSIIGLLQYLTPVIQFILGVYVFGEDVPPARLAGFVLIWAALALLTVDGLHHGRRQVGVRRAARAHSPQPVPEGVVAAVPLVADAGSVDGHDSPA